MQTFLFKNPFSIQYLFFIRSLTIFHLSLFDYFKHFSLHLWTFLLDRNLLEKRLCVRRNDSTATISYEHTCMHTYRTKSPTTHLSIFCVAATAVAIFSIFRKKKYFSVEFIHTFGSWKRRHRDTEKVRWKAVESFFCPFSLCT